MISRKRKIDYSEDEVIAYVKQQLIFYKCIEASLFLDKKKDIVLKSTDVFDLVDQIMEIVNNCFNNFFDDYDLTVNMNHDFEEKNYLKYGTLRRYSINIDEVFDNAEEQDLLPFFQYFIYNLRIFIDNISYNAEPKYKGLVLDIQNSEILTFKDYFYKTKTALINVDIDNLDKMKI